MELLIKDADWVVTPHAVRQDTDIFVEDGRITGFERGEADRVINADGCMVMPGIVNTHTHIPMSCFRGLLEDKPLKEWLVEEVWPREKRLNERTVYLAAKLGIMEALQFGTTSFLSTYFHSEGIVRAAEELGVRAWVGESTGDFLGKGEEGTVRKIEKHIRSIPDGGLVNPAISSHSVHTCSAELIQGLHGLADDYGLTFAIHVGETREEEAKIVKRKGDTPIRYLDKLGVVDHHFLAAHGIWLNPAEMVVLERRGGSVAHSPTSNLRLGSGIAPVAKYLSYGVNVSLGTDGQGSGSSLDLFREMKLAALLQKLEDPSFESRKALEMATVRGARALGFDGGVIEGGAPADLAIVDTRKPHMQPLVNKKQALNNLVHSASGQDVLYTIVNGRVVYDGELEYEPVVEELRNHLIMQGIIQDY